MSSGVERWVERLYHATTASRRLEQEGELEARPRRHRSKSVEHMQTSLIEYATRQGRRARNKGGRKKGGVQGMFESAEMIAARRALKHDPQVLAALKEWWIATDADESGAIDRDEYIELLKAIYRVKVTANDEVDCQKSAEADAADDFVGIDEMDEKHFHDAIFECVAVVVGLNGIVASARCPMRCPGPLRFAAG